MDDKPSAELMVLDWLMRSYLPACLILIDRPKPARVLRRFKTSAEYINKRLLFDLSVDEPPDILDFLLSAGAHPLFAKVEKAISTEKDAHGATLIAAGKAWYAAMTVLEYGADRSGFDEAVDQMNARLEKLLDARLTAATPTQ